MSRQRTKVDFGLLHRDWDRNDDKFFRMPEMPGVRRDAQRKRAVIEVEILLSEHPEKADEIKAVIRLLRAKRWGRRRG